MDPGDVRVDSRVDPGQVFEGAADARTYDSDDGELAADRIPEQHRTARITLIMIGQGRGL